MEMTEREQFTFYGSFYRAMRRITDKAVRADIFDCLCQYALYQQVPELESMAPEATLMYEMAKPVLDVARKKAIGGKTEIRPWQDKGKTETRPRKDKGKTKVRQEEDSGKEKENEIENEVEIEDECHTAFDLFWERYPRKVKKQDARAVFENVDVPVGVLLDALARQKESGQWLEEGGRFVPYPAAWLRDRRWEDELPAAPAGVPKGCGPVTDSELGDMERQMAAASGG